MSPEILNEIRQILRQHESRLNAVINRAVLEGVDGSQLAQLLNVKGLAGQEKVVELFENYGLSASYLPGAEVLRFAIDGYEDLSIAVGVADKRHRPKDLQQGEVCLYTNQDDGGHRVHLKQGKVIEAKSGDNTFELSPDGFKVTIGSTVLEVASDKVEVTVGPNTFTIEADGTTTLMDLTAQLISVATHIHAPVVGGPGYTGPPGSAP